jgi:hypothetical protein
MLSKLLKKMELNLWEEILKLNLLIEIDVIMIDLEEEIEVEDLVMEIEIEEEMIEEETDQEDVSTVMKKDILPEIALTPKALIEEMTEEGIEEEEIEMVLETKENALIVTNMVIKNSNVLNQDRIEEDTKEAVDIETVEDLDLEVEAEEDVISEEEIADLLLEEIEEVLVTIENKDLEVPNMIEKDQHLVMVEAEVEFFNICFDMIRYEYYNCVKFRYICFKREALIIYESSNILV